MPSTIPVISLKSLNSSDPASLEKLAMAATDWGFFQLTEHGIPSKVETKFSASMASFFGQSKSEKQRCSRTDENPWGFFDRELTKNKQDWKEIFDLGIDQQDDRYTSRTPWPENPDNFRSVMLDWYDRCESISQALLEALCRSLSQPETTLSAFFKPINSSFLRLNYYPVCDDPADKHEDYPKQGQLGISHHTDAGAITVLLQGEVAGLQVRKDENWITIPVVPESLIVNIGDLIQVWSNDRYQAPLHRVLASKTEERYSAAFFMNPTFSTDCIPLVDQPARYKPVNWGEFRASRAAGDYANLGDEIQISDYRISD